MVLAAQILEAVTGKLEKVLGTRTVIGEPMQVGDLTLIPVVDVMFGFGAGGGEGKEKEGTGGTGGGGGGGARVSAKAVIVVRGNEVSVLPLGRGGVVDRLLEAVPGVVDKVLEAAPGIVEKLGGARQEKKAEG